MARASVDADIVAELGAAHIARIVSALRDRYCLSEERVRDAVARKASFNVIHLDTMLKIDVFVSRNRPLDQRAFERSRPASIGGGTMLPICSAEDIILAKLEWYRRGGEVSERQWTDVMGVLHAMGTTLDLGYLRQGAVEADVQDLLTRALREAGHAD